MGKEPMKYYHREAFCLMWYQDTDGNRERIWNSRDGVTPFSIRSRQGLDATHVDWDRDEWRPFHIPEVGDRIFVDLTVERATEYRTRWYDRNCSDPECKDDFLTLFPDREAAINQSAESDAKMGAPDLVTVTPEMRDLFVRAWRPRRFS
jgi:hypothetical protein